MADDFHEGPAFLGGLLILYGKGRGRVKRGVMRRGAGSAGDLWLRN